VTIGWVNSEPEITSDSENPPDTQTDIESELSNFYNHFNITVTDKDNAIQSINVTWRTNSSGSWKDMGYNESTECNSTFYCTNVSWIDTYNQKYWWSVNVSDNATNKGWTNETYSFTTIDYTPDAPDLTGATVNSDTQITITWTDDTEADSTYIEWDSVNDTEWSRGEHNDTGINASSGSEAHTGLSSGTTYYYKAWSWNSTQSVWSSGSDVIDATTNTVYWNSSSFGGSVTVEFSNTYPLITNEQPTNESTDISLLPTLSIDVSDSDANEMNITWYSNSTQLSHSNWNGHGGRANRTGVAEYNEYSPIQNTLIWSKDILDDFDEYGGSTIIDGIVYHPTKHPDGKFYALYLNNGTEKWNTTTGKVDDTATYYDGMLYIQTDLEGFVDEKLICLWASNGTEKWNFTEMDATTTYTGPPTIDPENNLVISVCSNKVYGVNINDGSEEWNYTTDENTAGGTGSDVTYFNDSLVGGIVVFSSANWGLYCLWSENGTEIWHQDDDSFDAWDSNPIFTTIEGTDVLLHSGGDTLDRETSYCLYPNNGTIIWEESSGVSSMVLVQAYNDGKLLRGGNDNVLRCIDTAFVCPFGRSIWNFTTSGDIYGAPVISNGYVYFTSYNDKKLWCLYENNGTEVWNETFDSGCYGQPSVGDGILVVGCDDGYLRAYGDLDQYNKTQQGYYIEFGTNNSVYDDTYTQTNSNFSEYNTTYWWKVNVNDGTNETIEFYHFTTEEEPIYVPSKSLKIRIDKDYIDEPLTNFPLMIRLNSTISAECDSGKSISFNNSDNTTTFNHEIENGTAGWDNSGYNYVWVNVTSISADADTIIWMRYNDSDCENQENVSGVWNSDYYGVWHLNHSADTNIKDSSIYSNAGTNTNATFDSSGKIGGGYQFSNESEPDGHAYIRIVHDDSSVENELDFSNKTTASWACWIRSNDDLVGNDYGSSFANYMLFKPQATLRTAFAGWSEDGLHTCVWNRSVDDGDNRESAFYANSVDADDWKYVVGTFNGSYVAIYVDGVLRDSNPIDDFTLQEYPAVTYYDWFIGTKNQDASENLTFNGTMDQVEINENCWNASWIKARYHNQNITENFVRQENTIIFSTTLSSNPVSFSTTSSTDYNVNATGQSNGVCAINITNDGDVPINITIKLNESIGNNIYLKWNDSFNPPGYTPSSTAVGGDIDIISSADYGTDDGVYWFENDGSEDFDRYLIHKMDRASSATAGDLDGDGDLDLVTSDVTNDTIMWFENDGSESFTNHTIDNACEKAWDSIMIDVEPDGDMDVLGIAADAPSQLGWYENNSDGTFTKHIIDTNYTCARKCYAADIDGDNDIDFFSTASTKNDVRIHINDGEENFENITIDDNLAYAFDVFAIDVEPDGDMDILAAGAVANDVIWYENETTSFTKHTIDGDFSAVRAVFGIDVDDDGDTDVVAGASGADEVVWYENDGAESFTKRDIDTNANGSYDVFAIDIDGDNDIDIISANSDDDEVCWYESDGLTDPSFTKHVVGDLDNVRTVFGIDLDEDGGGGSTPYSCGANVTTSPSTIKTDLAVDDSFCLYLWADFDNLSSNVDISRLLNITASAGTGYSVDSSYSDVSLSFTYSEAIDCELNTTTWIIGELGVGNSATKNFKFWQNGSVNIDVEIGISNTNFTFVNYSDWNADGFNQYCANFTNDSWVSEHNIKISPYNETLKLNFAPGNFDFGVRIWMPKTMDVIDKREDFEVVLTVTQHT